MDKNQILQVLSNENLRVKQIYASMCLRRYCKRKGIEHSSIDEILGHLDSIGGVGNLTEWETYGASLALNGRGDPIPLSLAVLLPDDEKNEFMVIVDSAVEVGIVDMYGGSTGLPIKFLGKIVDILEKNEIQLPELTGGDDVSSR